MSAENRFRMHAGSSSEPLTVSYRAGHGVLREAVVVDLSGLATKQDVRAIHMHPPARRHPQGFRRP